MSTTNGHTADDVADLLNRIQDVIVPFIRAADDGPPRPPLVEAHPPCKLESLLALDLPDYGAGAPGLLAAVQRILHYSVNTWDQGFMDKLYASTNAVGLASELVLATLNTNAHVYAVAPAVTVVEKATARALAGLFGLAGPHAGGVAQPGGSAANQSAIVIARNALFPETKARGIAARRFVLFTSAHGHYSVEKAAQMFGFGADAVRAVPVDEHGAMAAGALETMVGAARDEGAEPFFVNATAGTTVLGSYDPLAAVGDVCARHGLWMHVDGSWGGAVVFSERQRWRLGGVERADSVAVTPHKMLGVPLTCSFLLGRDMRQFHQAMTLRAGYLFHGGDDEGEGTTELYDLADMTPQCGRKGDALKMFLGWLYYGREGYAAMIDRAFQRAGYLADIISKRGDFRLVSDVPLPCLQVCFYFARDGKLRSADENSKTTASIAKSLVNRGFMIDYAPGEHGKFFRVVVNSGTQQETLDGLVAAIEDEGNRLEEQ